MRFILEGMKILKDMLRVKSKPIVVGDVYPTNEGGSVTVIKYGGWNDVLVEHNTKHKYRMVVQSSNLRRGTLKDPYLPVIYGKGFMGSGEYRPSLRSGKNTRHYETWRGMLRRRYSAQHQIKNPTYSQCEVHEDWYNFQVFAKWFDEQPNKNTKGFALDKDLLVIGSKIYSQDTCSLVPQAVNNLLTDSRAARGYLPQGVSVNYKGWQVSVNINGTLKTFGTFCSIEKAFNVYKKVKEGNVKAVANKYKEDLHPQVYENLMKWELPQQKELVNTTP